MKITPVQTWSNGQAKEATEFNLRIISDNLLDSATFYYSLSSEEVSHMEKVVMTPATETEEETYYEVKVIDKQSEVVAEGNLSMDSVEYAEWDNSNEGAYAYAVNKLKLVVVLV